jgi:hypothetical protein
MRRLLDEMPLLRALSALSPRRERGATALYAVIFAFMAIAIATPLSSSLVAELMAAHHFRPTSWPAWGALQAAPKMYSFAHTCWIGSAPLFEQGSRAAAESRFLRERFWVNHYPARRVRFDANRGALGSGVTRFVYVRSTYLGASETTAFKVRIEPGRLVWEGRAIASEAP